ncbi:MAG TPA: site-2 protease family protein, partial [Pyrinomonadaceae bacterium]|nr:site-2 protease family protein [Pyrinomonadaceae bacterium]
YLRHGLFLLLTFCTATFAGMLFPFGKVDTLPEADPQSWGELASFIFSLPVKYFVLIGSVFEKIAADPSLLFYGLCFSVSLLFILLSHELGHYIACRIYRVDATLPYFIPTPPMVGPAGTFGAFIKIMSPMPSRKAVFDIGVAGPIAGFIALIPVLMVGLFTSKFLQNIYFGIQFSKPLLVRLIESIVGIQMQAGIGNPFYFAAWVGLLVTALNLIPSGQLDGGHAIYAVFGETVHRWTGRIAFVVMAILSISGFYFFGSPSGFLIAILLGVMMRIKHPRPYDETPLDNKRRLVAILVLLIFILSFLPFPIGLEY